MSAPDGPSPAITSLLSRWSLGDRGALDRVLPLVYAELRKIAARQLRREPVDQPLQPTDLVHQLFLQLVDQRHATWENRQAFYAVAAQMMRRILIDHARARRAAKRGGLASQVALHDVAETRLPPGADRAAADVLFLDQVIERLRAHDALQAEIVDLRFFLGLSIEETAAVIGKAPATVKREWRLARAWLFREMRGAR